MTQKVKTAPVANTKKHWFATGTKTGTHDVHHQPRDGFFQ